MTTEVVVWLAIIVLLLLALARIAAAVRDLPWYADADRAKREERPPRPQP